MGCNIDQVKETKLDVDNKHLKKKERKKQENPQLAVHQCSQCMFTLGLHDKWQFISFLQ